MDWILTFTSYIQLSGSGSYILWLFPEALGFHLAHLSWSKLAPLTGDKKVTLIRNAKMFLVMVVT